MWGQNWQKLGLVSQPNAPSYGRTPARQSFAREPLVIDTLRVIKSGGCGYPVTDLFAIVAGLFAVFADGMLLMLLALGFAVTADTADDLGQVLYVRRVSGGQFAQRRTSRDRVSDGLRAGGEIFVSLAE